MSYKAGMHAPVTYYPSFHHSCGIRVLVLALALVIMQAAGGTAHGFQSYLNTFNSTYGTAGTRLDSCVLCHINLAGGGARNAYGSDFANASIGNHTFNATLEARDSDGDGFTNIVEINARFFPGDPNDHPAAALTITTTSPLPAGTVGTAYSQTLAATGGTTPYSWSVTAGALPAGLNLNASTGAITGTPTTAGTFNFTVQVSGGGTATKAFSLTINPAGVQDNVAPVVNSTVPDNNATGVVVTAVSATFSEAISSDNVTTTSFTLTRGVDNVAGSVSVNGAVATFTPSVALADNTTYTATLTTAITDLAGNHLAANYVWTFTTGTTVVPPPPISIFGRGDGGGGCAMAGSGSGVKGLAGAYGILMLTILGLGIRNRRKRK